MIKLLAMAASLRTGSFNRMLIRIAAEHARAAGAEVTLIDLREFQMPYYDGDIEETRGLPDASHRLTQLIHDHDGMMVASPEYNASIPGHFKNTFDWVSRERPMPFARKPVMLLSTSPGDFGGARGVPHLRASFDAVGAFVYPGIPTLAKAMEEFDEHGKLHDPETEQWIRKSVLGFVDFATRLTTKAHA